MPFRETLRLGALVPWWQKLIATKAQRQKAAQSKIHYLPFYN